MGSNCKALTLPLFLLFAGVAFGQDSRHPVDQGIVESAIQTITAVIHKAQSFLQSDLQQGGSVSNTEDYASLPASLKCDTGDVFYNYTRHYLGNVTRIPVQGREVHSLDMMDCKVGSATVNADVDVELAWGSRFVTNAGGQMERQYHIQYMRYTDAETDVYLSGTMDISYDSTGTAVRADILIEDVVSGEKMHYLR